MSKYQPTPRYSLTRGASAARQINSQRTMAQSVLDATIEYESDKPVILCRANEPMLVGQAVVQNGKQFFLVASKFSNRYYVIVNNKDAWQCSSKDETVARLMIAKAQTYRAELIAAKAEKVNMQRLTDIKLGDAYEHMDKQVVRTEYGYTEDLVWQCHMRYRVDGGEWMPLTDETGQQVRIGFHGNADEWLRVRQSEGFDAAQKWYRGLFAQSA